jgi:hypothetical protein
MKRYGRQVNPEIVTVAQFAGSAATWVFLVYVACDRLFIHHYLKEKFTVPVMMIIWVFFYYLIDRALIDNYKYLDIYNKYKDYASNNSKAKRDLILSFILVSLPFIIIVIYAFTGF